MGKSFKWALLKDAASLDIAKTYHGAIGVVTGTDYDGHEGVELARDFAANVKPKDVVSVFIPSLADEKVDEFNFSGATLKKVVEEGILEPVIMGSWIKTKAGNSFPQPYLAFFEAKADVTKTAKKKPAKKTGRFVRK
jgi:hypothetical protein